MTPESVLSESEIDDFCERVSESYELWSRNPADMDSQAVLNLAIELAYRYGVKISLEISDKALIFSESIDKKKLEKLKRYENNKIGDNKIIFNSYKEVRNNYWNYSGRASGLNGGCLQLHADTTGLAARVNFAGLKPKDIESFIPIKPSV